MPPFLFIACAAAYALAAAGGYWQAVRLHRDRILRGDMRTLLFQSRWNWVAQPVLSGILLLVYRHWIFAVPLFYAAAYWGIIAGFAHRNTPSGERPDVIGNGVAAVAAHDPRSWREFVLTSFAPTLLTIVGITTVSISAGVASALRISGPHRTSSLWWLIPLLALLAALVCWIAGALTGATTATLALGLLKRRNYLDNQAASTPPSGGGAKRQRRALSALNGRLERCFRAGEYEAAIQVSNEVVTRFGSSKDQDLVWRVAVALLNRSAALQLTRGAAEGIDACDELVRRYGDDSDLRVRCIVAEALVKKGVWLGDVGRDVEALETFDAVVERVGRDEEPKLREQCAHALWFKAIAVLKGGRRDEAFELLYKSVKTYPDVRFRMAIDSDLSPLEDDDRWASLMRPEQIK